MEKQRTPEWHKKREHKITGSAVGAILGLNKWKTPDQHMADMVNEYKGIAKQFEGNRATEFGNKFEKYALDDYMLLHAQEEVNDTGFHIHPEHGWLGASPDGLIGNDGVLEIKCPISKKDSDEFESIYKQMHYYAQVQVELYCTGRLWCDFYQWSPVGEMLERIKIDNEWIDENIPKLKDFYNRYLSNRDKDISEIQNLMQEYKRISQEIKDLELIKKKYQEDLVKACDEEECDLGEIGRVIKVERKGSIDYKAIPVLEGVNLEIYRKEPTSYWSIK